MIRWFYRWRLRVWERRLARLRIEREVLESFGHRDTHIDSPLWPVGWRRRACEKEIAAIRAQLSPEVPRARVEGE